MEKILFIGGGNMARALIAGIHKNFEIFVVEKNDEKRTALIKNFGVTTFCDSSQVKNWRDFDVVIFAIKPQQFYEKTLFVHPAPQALIISIMAGVSIAKISAFFTYHPKIIRAMPNTPALMHKAVTGLFAGEKVSERRKKLAEKIFKSVGKTFWVDDEAQINAVTALSGSGPAYIFYFLESFQKSALALGFDKKTARMLALETFSGSVELAQTDDFRELRHKVTSRGGTTEAAISILRKADVVHIVQRAVRAAHSRARELSELSA